MVLTSNNTRELSEALKRRCLFLHIGYPDPSAEKEILTVRVPGIAPHLADPGGGGGPIGSDSIDLKKSPSVSETIDWARTLIALGIERVDEEAVSSTLHVLLKHQSDIEKVAKEFSLQDPLLGTAVEPD